MRIRNPFRSLFKPKEKPDDPLERIPEEWKKQNAPQGAAEEEPQESQETQETQETPKRGRGRPPKKTVVPAKAAPDPEKARVVKLPQRIPVRLRSYQSTFKFRSIPHFRQIKRALAAFLLLGMIVSTVVLFFTAPIYAPILTILIGFILCDYLWITGIPKTPKETIKFNDPQKFADWLKKQNVMFEVNKKEED